MQLLWKGLRPISSPERFQSPGVGSWKGKWGGGRSLHWLWERNWHRKWSHMAQIYCVRDFPFKTHYIHSSERCMAQPHSFLGSGIRWNCCSAVGWWWQFYHSSARELEVGTVLAKTLLSAALSTEPCRVVCLKLHPVALLVRRREKYFWALNIPKGKQKCLEGKHKGKNFSSNRRNKMIFAEQHVLSKVNYFGQKGGPVCIFLF